MAGPKLGAGTAIGAVELTVADLERSVGFYERVIGFHMLESDGGRATLGAGGRPLLVLHGDPSAPPRPRRTTGLFHFAILLPSRRDLASWLGRLAEERWPITGASDHLVSEAIYLHDPDDVGIEVYRDRAPEEWPWEDGEVRMATLPLDVEDVMAERDGWEGAPAGARIGHVHLNVADLGDAEAFYCEGVGFEVTTRSYPGALFVSAGGYHHHVGLNVWNGPGAPPPPHGAIGLRRFTVELGDAAELDAAAARLAAAGAASAAADGGVLAEDPSRNGVLLAAAEAA